MLAAVRDRDVYIHDRVFDRCINGSITQVEMVPECAHLGAKMVNGKLCAQCYKYYYHGDALTYEFAQNIKSNCDFRSRVVLYDLFHINNTFMACILRVGDIEKTAEEITFQAALEFKNVPGVLNQMTYPAKIDVIITIKHDNRVSYRPGASLQDQHTHENAFVIKCDSYDCDIIRRAIEPQTCGVYRTASTSDLRRNERPNRDH